MINGSQPIPAALALALAALLPLRALADGPAPVDLRSAARFAILAGSAITSTGGGTNQGDVGLSPTTGAAITGLTTNRVSGRIYTVDDAGPEGRLVDAGLLSAAKNDLTAAYNDAAARTHADVVNPGAGEIGGLTLGPGLYEFTSTALITAGNLTLTGTPVDVWIFQIGTALTVGSSIRVILAGGAQARNVFWQVGSSATLGTTCDVKGTLLADQSITMNTGSTVEGRVLARIAQVTFDGQRIRLPEPEAPRFTDIYRTALESMTVVVNTTPYCPLTLEITADVGLTNWTPIATDTPVASPWTFADETATATVSQRFYRAFITPY